MFELITGIEMPLVPNLAAPWKCKYHIIHAEYALVNARLLTVSLELCP
jgi:hypothetical protein